jgi:DNA ligase (NAD+)
MDSQKDRLFFLADLGFDTVFSVRIDSDDIELLKSTIEFLKLHYKERKIPIDGIVGMFDSISYGESLGMTGHHPKHSLAFKLYQEDNETKLTDIEWATSRTGLINPVAVFEPVEIDGTTVTRATLNNVSFIKELELGIGDTITVIKSNQIIPMITQNLTRSNTYQLPAVCPSCGHPVVIRNDNGREMMYCNNPQCGAVLHDRIANFASRQGMNIVGVSNERLKILIDNGFVSCFKDLYYLSLRRDEIARLDGFGANSVDNLLMAIEDSRKCKLANVLVAIGIPNVGKSTARIIADYCEKEYKDSESLTARSPFDIFLEDCWCYTEWDVLPSIGQATSDEINGYINNHLKELMDLEHELKIIVDDTSESSDNLSGKTFCITGKLVRFENRNALVDEIEKRGGKVVSSVTAKTNYLITNDKTSGSSKNRAAEKFGTKIISEDEFIAGDFDN